MPRLWRLVLLSFCLLGMSGCGHAVRDTLRSGFGGGDQWSGPVVPANPSCGARATGLMTLGSKEFSFAPFSSTVVIHGRVEKNRLSGSAREAAPGQAGVVVQFAGTISRPASGPPVIQGSMTSGRCAWTVALHRD